jgi:hypothetical protein
MFHEIMCPALLLRTIELPQAIYYCPPHWKINGNSGSKTPAESALFGSLWNVSRKRHFRHPYLLREMGLFRMRIVLH